MRPLSLNLKLFFTSFTLLLEFLLPCLLCFFLCESLLFYLVPQRTHWGSMCVTLWIFNYWILTIFSSAATKFWSSAFIWGCYDTKAISFGDKKTLFTEGNSRKKHYTAAFAWTFIFLSKTTRQYIACTTFRTLQFSYTSILIL